MYSISLNSQLVNLVAGKTVALIGPAPYLKNTNMGDKIDSYDIVVRPNEIIPPKDIRKDYGSKTDIMFCNFGTPWMPGIKRKIETGDNKKYFKELKLVVASAIKSTHSELNYLSWKDDYVSDVVANFNSINEYDLPFYWIGVKDYKAMYYSIGVEYNTGMAAIMMLLKYPIKELFVSGFSFYKGGNKYENLYYKGHMDEKDTAGRSFGFNAGHGRHANLKQLEYFKNLLKLYPNTLKIDEKMKEYVFS